MRTHEKGDIGVAMIIADLTLKGYTVFRPVIAEQLPYDLLADVSGKIVKIQCKYSTDGHVRNRTCYMSSKGAVGKAYSHSSFDYCAIYVPIINKVLYLPSTLGGIKINIKEISSKCTSMIWWWEDFLDFTDVVQQRSYQDFFPKKTPDKKKNISRWPDNEIFQKMLLEKSMTDIGKDYGVTKVSVAKHAKKMGLTLPPVGFWNKKVDNNKI